MREEMKEWLLGLLSSSAVTFCVLLVYFEGFLCFLERVGHSLLQAFVPLELLVLAVDNGFAVPEGRLVDLGL